MQHPACSPTFCMSNGEMSGDVKRQGERQDVRATQPSPKCDDNLDRLGLAYRGGECWASDP